MLTGKLVRLRAIERSDLPHFVEWLNDPEVIQGLMLYLPLSMDQEEEWYAGLAKRPMEERPLGIEACMDDRWELIGNLSFHRLDWRNRNAEVGIVIGDKRFWSKGYGSEAMKLMVKHGFERLNLNRIYLHVYETNPRAIRSYEKVGFTLEGRLRQAIYKDGKFIDVLVMSVLKDEWHEPEI